MCRLIAILTAAVVGFWTAASASNPAGRADAANRSTSGMSCHPLTTEFGHVWVSEYTLGEQTVADDFVPAGDAITTVTTSGVYISRIANEVDPVLGCRQRTAYPMPDPVDKFRIRIYADGADDGETWTEPAMPGWLVSERYASSTGAAWGVPNEGTVLRTEDPDGPNTLHFGPDELTDEDYVINLGANPITGLVLDGRRYWIEIMNNMEESPPDDDGDPSCVWLINEAAGGNGHAAWGGQGILRLPIPADFAFCLDVTFAEPPTPIGACCTCSDGTCADLLPQINCTTEGDKWFMHRDCAALRAEGSCVVGGLPNDECAGALEIGPGKAIDADPAEGRVTVRTFHQCATTSLPTVRLCDEHAPWPCASQCDAEGGSFIGEDLWFTYIPPVDGELYVDTCQTGIGWDSMLAMYKGPPGTGACPCPTDVASCEDAAFHDEHGRTADDDGCAIKWAGPAALRRPVVAGTCYAIQFGSWRARGPVPGDGYLSLYLDYPRAPEPLPCANDFAAAANGAGGERLPRFGCVAASSDDSFAGNTWAVRVELKNLYNTAAGDPDGARVCPRTAPRTKPGLDQFAGDVRWLGPPADYFDETAPVPAPKYIGARLVCDPAEASVRDWSQEVLEDDFPNADPSRFFFYGPEVPPCSVYEVNFCANPLDLSTCSDNPLIVQTGVCGDVWPPFSLSAASFADIAAVIAKFKNIAFTPGTPPQGGAPKWHAALRGNVPPVAADVSFADIAAAVAGFKSATYNEDGPCDPATGRDTCGALCNTAPGF